MEWYRRVHFIAAVPMPEAVAEEYGTTINGMWASPEAHSRRTVQELHAKGRRVLFSVPLIALTPHVYAREEHQYLFQEACADIEGNRSLVPWYYWESEPVYSMCIYSAVFRRYLFDRCRAAIDRGIDVVNLDEINSSIGLMNRRAGGSGFCKHCLERFRQHVREKALGHEGSALEWIAELAQTDDVALRQRLCEDDVLYEQYRRFHEMEAFCVVVDLIQAIRAYAQAQNPSFAITANVAYLGNLVPSMGDLWGPMWGAQLDFVMMENIYRPDPRGPHLLLPRGKFTAWYRLGSSFSSRSPTWICPSIQVPKQLAGEERVQYYLLMFVEAYANGGRWGYYWWPGVDVETRLRATAPEQLKEYIGFIARHRAYFEQTATKNELAILYLNSSMLTRPESHFKYLALAQALAESGYQYDVIYGGDGIYSSDELDLERLQRYRALLVPEAAKATDTQGERLAKFADECAGELVLFAPSQEGSSPQWATAYDEEMLFSFWRDYREHDRRQIAACVRSYSSARICVSHPLVNVVRYVKGEEQILHLVNYDYHSDRDCVSPAEKVTVSAPWERSRTPELRWLSLDGEERCPCRLEKGKVVFDVPRLELYGLAILC